MRGSFKDIPHQLDVILVWSLCTWWASPSISFKFEVGYSKMVFFFFGLSPVIFVSAASRSVACSAVV